MRHNKLVTAALHAYGQAGLCEIEARRCPGGEYELRLDYCRLWWLNEARRLRALVEEATP